MKMVLTPKKLVGFFLACLLFCLLPVFNSFYLLAVIGCFKLFLLFCVLDFIRKTNWRKNVGLLVAVIIVALIVALLLELLAEATGSAYA